MKGAVSAANSRVRARVWSLQVRPIVLGRATKTWQFDDTVVVDARRKEVVRLTMEKLYNATPSDEDSLMGASEAGYAKEIGILAKNRGSSGEASGELRGAQGSSRRAQESSEELRRAQELAWRFAPA